MPDAYPLPCLCIRSPMKILVIEDSRTNLNLLCSFVSNMGFTAIPASSGNMGIDLFSKEHPHLILLDIIMPDIDGYEVARQIRHLESHGEWTPIIFLSGLNKDSDIEKGIAAGGDDYLLKPVSEIVLGAKIRAMQRIIQMRQSLIAVTQKLNLANQELQRLSSLDGLTGVANRRHFDETLLREWQYAIQQGSELAIIMCDIDFFKPYNDSYGHLSGDECLRQVAQTLSRTVPPDTGLLARYGGEEFVAVLPNTSLNAASQIAEHMRQAVYDLNIPHIKNTAPCVTSSFGVAASAGAAGIDPNSIVRSADLALYKAKHRGKNRVCQNLLLTA